MNQQLFESVSAFHDKGLSNDQIITRLSGSWERQQIEECLAQLKNKSQAPVSTIAADTSDQSLSTSFLNPKRVLGIICCILFVAAVIGQVAKFNAGQSAINISKQRFQQISLSSPPTSTSGPTESCQQEDSGLGGANYNCSAYFSKTYASINLGEVQSVASKVGLSESRPVSSLSGDLAEFANPSNESEYILVNKSYPNGSETVYDLQYINAYHHSSCFVTCIPQMIFP